MTLLICPEPFDLPIPGNCLGKPGLEVGQAPIQSDGLGEYPLAAESLYEQRVAGKVRRRIAGGGLREGWQVEGC